MSPYMCCRVLRKTLTVSVVEKVFWGVHEITIVMNYAEMNEPLL